MVTRRLGGVGLQVLLQETAVGSGPYTTDAALICGFPWCQAHLPTSQTSQILSIWSRWHSLTSTDAPPINKCRTLLRGRKIPLWDQVRRIPWGWPRGKAFAGWQEQDAVTSSGCPPGRRVLLTHKMSSSRQTPQWTLYSPLGCCRSLLGVSGLQKSSEKGKRTFELERSEICLPNYLLMSLWPSVVKQNYPKQTRLCTGVKHWH